MSLAFDVPNGNESQLYKNWVNFSGVVEMSKCFARVPFDRIIRDLFVRAPSKYE